jgi:hypothetical protein
MLKAINFRRATQSRLLVVCLLIIVTAPAIYLRIPRGELTQPIVGDESHIIVWALTLPSDIKKGKSRYAEGHLLLLNLLFTLQDKYGIYSNIQKLVLSHYLNAVLSTFIVVLAFFCARRMYGIHEALIASFFVAVSPGLVWWTHIANADIPNIFWMMLTFYCIIRLLESNSVLWYALTGILWGYSFSVKYFGVILVFPLLAAHLLKTLHKSSLNHFLFDRRHTLLLITLLFFIISVYTFSPILVKNFIKGSGGKTHVKKLLRSNLNKPHARFGVTGETFIQKPGLYHLFILMWLNGIPLFISFLAGLVVSLTKKTRPDIIIFFLLIPALGMFSILKSLFFRWLIIFLPFTAIYAARFFSYGVVNKNHGIKNLVKIFFILTAAYTLAYTSSSLRGFDEDPRLEAYIWLRKNVMPDYRILCYSRCGCSACFNYHKPELKRLGLWAGNPCKKSDVWRAVAKEQYTRYDVVVLTTQEIAKLKRQPSSRISQRKIYAEMQNYYELVVVFDFNYLNEDFYLSFDPWLEGPGPWVTPSVYVYVKKELLES